MSRRPSHPILVDAAAPRPSPGLDTLAAFYFYIEGGGIGDDDSNSGAVTAGQAMGAVRRTTAHLYQSISISSIKLFKTKYSIMPHLFRLQIKRISSSGKGKCNMQRGLPTKTKNNDNTIISPGKSGRGGRRNMTVDSEDEPNRDLMPMFGSHCNGPPCIILKSCLV